MENRGSQAGRQAARQAGRQANRSTGKWTNRQAHAERHTHKIQNLQTQAKKRHTKCAEKTRDTDSIETECVNDLAVDEWGRSALLHLLSIAFGAETPKSNPTRSQVNSQEASIQTKESIVQTFESAKETGPHVVAWRCSRPQQYRPHRRWRNSKSTAGAQRRRRCHGRRSAAPFHGPCSLPDGRAGTCESHFHGIIAHLRKEHICGIWEPPRAGLSSSGFIEQAGEEAEPRRM